MHYNVPWYNEHSDTPVLTYLFDDFRWKFLPNACMYWYSYTRTHMNEYLECNVLGTNELLVVTRCFFNPLMNFTLDIIYIHIHVYTYIYVIYFANCNFKIESFSVNLCSTVIIGKWKFPFISISDLSIRVK